ncbi:MAG TPA: glycosyltransferase [Cytophagaceae bacterium]
MSAPLVSVICLCYNHELFLREALESVVDQTYKNIEIIVVDDCSKDNSVTIIQEFIKRYPEIRFISNADNIGNCRSFNKAFQLSRGSYIIDFATDDVMYPDKIEKQVAALEQAGGSYGVVYSDAAVIDERGKFLYNHFDNLNRYKLKEIPQGDIYKILLEKFFLPTTTMLVRREVLEELGGYDESLTYEDFDFWIRSSRNWKYLYVPEVLNKRRLSTYSFSNQFLYSSTTMHWSTYRVCQKALWLNKTKEENEALLKRVEAEMKTCYFLNQFDLVIQYNELLKSAHLKSSSTTLWTILSRLKIPMYWFYKLYKKIR